MDVNLMLQAAVALFVIMDPFASLPVFIALTRKASAEQKSEAANVATLVAGGVLIAFTLAGPPFLALIGVTMESFMIGGGIMLLLIAASMVLGFSYEQTENQRVGAAAVLIGVPLITGPGAMTTATIMAANYGLDTVLAAIVITVIASWLVLKTASPIYKKIGDNGAEVMSRIGGLILAAIAVEFIRTGFGLVI